MKLKAGQKIKITFEGKVDSAFMDGDIEVELNLTNDLIGRVYFTAEELDNAQIEIIEDVK